MLLPTNPHVVGGFNPSEKYESQMGLLFPAEWKNIYIIYIYDVPNHQPH